MKKEKKEKKGEKKERKDNMNISIPKSACQEETFPYFVGKTRQEVEKHRKTLIKIILAYHKSIL